MKIIRIDTYRDGGTVSIITNQGQYCINCGINVTDHVNRLFIGYPDKGNLISLEDSFKIKKRIKNAIKSFEGSISLNEYHAIENIKIN